VGHLVQRAVAEGPVGEFVAEGVGAVGGPETRLFPGPLRQVYAAGCEDVPRDCCWREGTPDQCGL
jgi:hypothetical protein